MRDCVAWVPGGGYKSQGKEWADMAEELKDRPWRQIKEAIVSDIKALVIPF